MPKNSKNQEVVEEYLYLPAELVNQSLSGDVFNDVLVVVVPHGT